MPIHNVKDLTLRGNAIERELAMIKVAGTGTPRQEALRLGEIFHARVIDTTTESFVFELTGPARKIDEFVELMRPLGPRRGRTDWRRRYIARQRADLEL